jgi:hypothetical protein
MLFAFAYSVLRLLLDLAVEVVTTVGTRKNRGSRT